MGVPMRNVNQTGSEGGECFAIVLFVHARKRLVSVLIAAGHTAAGMLYFMAVFIFPTRALVGLAILRRERVRRSTVNLNLENCI